MVRGALWFNVTLAAVDCFIGSYHVVRAAKYTRLEAAYRFHRCFRLAELLWRRQAVAMCAARRIQSQVWS